MFFPNETIAFVWLPTPYFPTGQGCGRIEGDRLVSDAFNSRRPNGGADNHDRGEGG